MHAPMQQFQNALAYFATAVSFVLDDFIYFFFPQTYNI